MTASVKAIIKPEILLWARLSAGYRDIGEAASKVGVKAEKLAAWESGSDSPTVVQLRKIAGVYKRPLAVFYLPNVPKGVDVLHDFRTVYGGKAGEYSPSLTFEIRRAYHRREKALELFEELGEMPEPVRLKASPTEDANLVADRIRQYLGVTKQLQESWKASSYEALNGWKSCIESHEILVFQASKVDVSEMRGFSIACEIAPVIVLNSADAPYARVFTLLHELAHISLLADGVCTLDSNKDSIEVFCNAVAGATLLPAEWLTSSSTDWSDDNIRATAKRYGISSQVVIRRLLTLGEISQSEYNRKKTAYEREAQDAATLKAERNTPVAQSTKVIASAGKLFTKLVLESYRRQMVTSADVSDLLSVRVQHFKEIESKVFR